MELNTVFTRVTKKTYEIKEGTKTVWVLVETEVNNITEEQYNRTVGEDTLKYFRRIGGTERAYSGYTQQGWKVTELISKDPSRQIKIVRSFNRSLLISEGWTNNFIAPRILI